MTPNAHAASVDSVDDAQVSVWMSQVLAKDKSAHLYSPNEPDGSAPRYTNEEI